MAGILQSVITQIVGGVIAATKEDSIEILDFDTEYTDDDVALWIED